MFIVHTGGVFMFSFFDQDKNVVDFNRDTFTHLELYSQ